MESLRTTTRRTALLAGAAVILSLAWPAAQASAQEKFPDKTIEVVIHSNYGGGTDTTARMMMIQKRHRDCRIVRRKGRVYIINKTNPRFKARQG